MKPNYYPPRAGILSGIMRWKYPLHRWLGRLTFGLLTAFPVRFFLLALFIPGYGFFAQGKLRWGRIAIGLYLGCALVFLLALGTMLGNLAFSLMCSIHTTSILFVLSAWLKPHSLVFRLLMMVLVFLLVWQCIYRPLVGLFNAVIAVPLRVENEVIIARPYGNFDTIQKGDIIIYRLSGSNYRGGAVRSGYGREKILGLPGDQIRISDGKMTVNGERVKGVQYLPETLYRKVTENEVFVWPSSLNIYTQGNVTEQYIGHLLEQHAFVHRDAILGRTYERWFGRKISQP